MNSLDAHNWCVKLFLRRSDGLGGYYDFNTKLKVRGPAPATPASSPASPADMLPVIQRRVARFVQRHRPMPLPRPAVPARRSLPRLAPEAAHQLVGMGAFRDADLDLYGEVVDAAGNAVASFAFHQAAGAAFAQSLRKIFVAPMLVGEHAVDALVAAFPQVPRDFVARVACNGGHSRSYLAARDILTSITAGGAGALAGLLRGPGTLDLADPETFPSLRQANADDWEVLSVGSVRSINSGLTTGTSLDGDWDLVDFAEPSGAAAAEDAEPIVEVRSTNSYAAALLRNAEAGPAPTVPARRPARALRRGQRRQAAQAQAHACQTALADVGAMPSWKTLDKFTATYGYASLADGALGAGPARRAHNPGFDRRRNKQNALYATKAAFRLSKPA